MLFEPPFSAPFDRDAVSAPKPVATHDATGSPRPEGALGRLTRTELRRRLWHMGPGLLPFVLWFAPHVDPFPPDLIGITLTVSFAIGFAIYRRYQRIQRGERDRQRLAAVAGYALPVLAALVLLPGDAEIAMAALGILAFGDGSATLGGILLGGPTLPWNDRKTWSGFACFLLLGTAAATVTYWGESNNPLTQHPGASWGISLCIAGGGALAGALVESLHSRINDNIRVGVTALATVAALHFLLT